jgi:hypothetical protein
VVHVPSREVREGAAAFVLELVADRATRRRRTSLALTAERLQLALLDYPNAVDNRVAGRGWGRGWSGGS